MGQMVCFLVAGSGQLGQDKDEIIKFPGNKSLCQPVTCAKIFRVLWK